jgi:hypothetical protein
VRDSAQIETRLRERIHGSGAVLDLTSVYPAMVFSQQLS